MNILHELWQDIEPRISTFQPESPYALLLGELAKLEIQFLADLPEEKRSLWEALSEKQSELWGMEKEDVFCHGVRLGAGFILALREPPPHSASRP